MRKEHLADCLLEAAFANADAALDSSDWAYAVEAMSFAANAVKVAEHLRASLEQM